MTFPNTRWEPLSVAEVAALFRDAPFPWGLAGGYAVEQFLGTPMLRSKRHAEVDGVPSRPPPNERLQPTASRGIGCSCRWYHDILEMPTGIVIRKVSQI